MLEQTLEILPGAGALPPTSPPIMTSNLQCPTPLSILCSLAMAPKGEKAPAKAAKEKKGDGEKKKKRGKAKVGAPPAPCTKSQGRLALDEGLVKWPAAKGRGALRSREHPLSQRVFTVLHLRCSAPCF
jgi:hypothetical protein